jgi:mannose-1-phosphate guanylyltransferase
MGSGKGMIESGAREPVPAEGQVAAPAQALILAAGLGERMRPLTSHRAKPSLPLLNRPMILHVLDLLARHGVRQVVVNLHHAPESITEMLERAVPPGMELIFSREEKILGTGGGIRRGMQFLDQSAPVIVLNADSISNVDLTVLMARHLEVNPADCLAATLCVKPRSKSEKYTPVHLDPDLRICGIGRTGRRGDPHTFMGLHILDPEILAQIKKKGAFDIVKESYMPHLKGGGTLGGLVHDGFWLEMGTPALYLAAQMDLLENVDYMLGQPPEAGIFREEGGAALLGPGSDCFAGQLQNVVVGPGCKVEEGASITGSLLGVDVRVGKGADVKDSVLWDGVRIPEGGSVKRKLVMRGESPGTCRSIKLS